MKLTKDTLQAFCEEQTWGFRISPTAKFRQYLGLRIYYPGCPLSSDCLYLADSSSLPSEDAPTTADLCLVGDQFLPRADCAYFITAKCGLLAAFSTLQTMYERLLDWDRNLSRLLLDGATLQEILEYSAPILRNPCLFEDNQFQVLASWGQVSREDAPLFYETLKSGRAPVNLFEGILSLSPQERAPYSSTPAAITVGQQFSPHDELLANCMSNGMIVLRFCMVCTRVPSGRVRGLVAHLMNRLENSPGIQQYAGWAHNSADSLFTRLIDDPTGVDVSAAASALGLNRFTLFSTVCIDFGTQTAEASSILAKLRMLLPGLCFFIYRDTPFALLGVSQKSGPLQDALERLEQLLSEQLAQLNASCGVSLSFSDLQHLGSACQQARCALDFLSLQPPGNSLPRVVHYQDALTFHILRTFFRQHDFSCYCPRFFLDLLNDDRSTGSNNLQLLHTYLSNECNATLTSRLLHMHRNNVIYRINRLQEKYHIDLDTSISRQTAALLCQAAKYQLDLAHQVGTP